MVGDDGNDQGNGCWADIVEKDRGNKGQRRDRRRPESSPIRDLGIVKGSTSVQKEKKQRERPEKHSKKKIRRSE